MADKEFSPVASKCPPENHPLSPKVTEVSVVSEFPAYLDLFQVGTSPDLLIVVQFSGSLS